MKRFSLLTLLFLLGLPLAFGCGDGQVPGDPDAGGVGTDAGEDAGTDGGEDAGTGDAGSDGGEEDEEGPTFTGPNPDAAPMTVRVLYLVPSDRALRADYLDAIGDAVLQLQQWYLATLDNGTTFRVNEELLVETLRSERPAVWFDAANGHSSSRQFDFYFNTLSQVKALLGDAYATDAFTYLVYVDAQGATGAGALGFTTMPEHDLKGLTGQMPEPISRWIGGAGHELGHAFGLPHPENESPDALMWTGYTIYPECVLQENDREILSGSPFFLPMVSETAAVSPW